MNGPGQDQRSEATRIADATVRTWDELFARLAPIIGEQGVRLLYRRSLQLAAPAFPCLASIPVAYALPSPADSPFADLRLALGRATPGEARESSRALFAGFTGLLNALIGQALTTRLLAPVLSQDDPNESPQEVAQ